MPVFYSCKTSNDSPQIYPVFYGVVKEIPFYCLLTLFYLYDTALYTVVVLKLLVIMAGIEFLVIFSHTYKWVLPFIQYYMLHRVGKA